jgi:hypothetical protein
MLRKSGRLDRVAGSIVLYVKLNKLERLEIIIL